MSASGGGRKAASTSSADLVDLLARAVGAVREAAAFALDPGEELRVEAKAHRNDLVTQVDRGAEERIVRRLEATGIPIHGEEAHRVEDFETYRGRVWVLDPIDGTLNYVSTHRDWAISLALVDDGVPVVAVLADPVAGRLYTAVRGRGVRVEPLTEGAAGAVGAAPRVLETVEDLPLSEGMVIAHYQLTQDAGIGRAIAGHALLRGGRPGDDGGGCRRCGRLRPAAAPALGRRGRRASVHRDRGGPHPDGRGALRRAPRRVVARGHPRRPRRGARVSVRRR